MSKQFFALAILLSSGQVLAGWDLIQDKDDFTDETKLYAAVSNETDGLLSIRCVAGVFEVMIYFHEYLGNEEVFVRYRIDKGKVTKGRGHISTDGTAIFIPNFKTVRLAKNFMQSELFVIEATDYRGIKHKQKFSLIGSSTPIQKVLDRCGLGE